MTNEPAAPPKGRRGRPPKGTGNKLTEHILEAATTLFLSGGFAGTSTDDVAAAANCSKRTLYTRFPTKDALFEAVVEKFARSRIDHFDDIATSGKTLGDRLRDAADRMVADYSDTEALAFRRLLRSESIRFPELVRMSVAVGLEPFIASITAIIEGDAKPVTKEFESRFLDEQFLSLIQWPISQKLFTSQVQDMDEMRREAHRSVDFFLRLYEPHEADQQ
jgi:TetR/AcrR family transcriptional regulator, mexJK operon transcriptional repressor